MFWNAFLLLFVSALLVGADRVSVSVGVAAKVGYASLRVTSKAAQRYKAGYFFADNLSLGMFADNVDDNAYVGIIGITSEVADLSDDLPGILRNTAWREQRLNMLAKIVLPVQGVYGDQAADPIFAINDVNVNEAYGIVLPGGAATAGRYAIVPVRDVEVLSKESVWNKDYVRGGLEAFLRLAARVHYRVSLGLEVGFSFDLGSKTRIENIAYAILSEDARKSYTSLGGAAITEPVDIKTFAYEIFGHEMVKSAWLDVDVQDKQRFSLFLQGHVMPSVTLAFACGMRYSAVTCVLGGGNISYPYAHRSISGVLIEEGGGGVAFQDIKCEGGIWAPVFGVSAEYMTSLGALSLGVECSFFDVQLKDVVKKFENPIPEDLSLYGEAHGWHMSRVLSLEQDFSYKLNMKYIAATASFVYRL